MPEYVTQSDLDTYGHDFLNVAKRVANTVVAPKLNQLEQRLAVESRRRLDAEVARLVPDYIEVDKDPRWHRYLLGIDNMSGRVRQSLLNEAISSGNARRVKAFFDEFKQGGGTVAAPSRRVSGRTYTRDQIAELYSLHRRGAYAGRETEWVRLENDIIAAGREGRILGAVDVHGK